MGDFNMFIFSFKQRIADCSEQNWSDDIHSSTRCDTYATFKSLLNVKQSTIWNCHFFLGNHLRVSDVQIIYRLNIEIGRHFGILRDQIEYVHTV
jgi:hypothetical protein